MQEDVVLFANVGAIGIVAYILLNNVIKEKKEDRDLYKESVTTFTDISKSYVESISVLTNRVEDVEEGVKGMDSKLDKILEKVGVDNE